MLGVYSRNFWKNRKKHLKKVENVAIWHFLEGGLVHSVYRQSLPKPPPISAKIEDLLLFWGVFCDFFKSYGSKPLTLIMFFVVLWEVVSPLRAIFDIMTQNRENRKKRVQKWPYLSPFEAFLKVKYSKNQGDDFEWFFKVVLMVLELYPGYGKVFRGFKESIPNLRTCF